ncbi:MAG TPA: DUF1800 family protein, partial [Anaerolineaceae bacterium]|nr:DUF1800 family protein [Anaerolineaceae bacterium]
MSTHPLDRPITRRRLIKIGAAAGAGILLSAACNPKAQPTLSPSVTPTSLSRSPQATSTPKPTLPPTLQPEPIQPNPQVPASTPALQRMGFGARPGDLEAFNALGSSDPERLEAYIEQQLHPESIVDEDLEAHYAAAQFVTLEKSLEQLVDEHIINNPFDDNDDQHWRWYVLPLQDTYQATFLRAVYSRKQLFELLVDFWHNHFNVYGDQDDIAPLFASYDRDVIRANVLGNFRQMLEAVASHPSMLYYLNNNSNSDAGPNENWARELFELHTLGAENYLGVRDPNSVPTDENGLAVGYVDNDVYEAARCFTGWRVDDDIWEGESDVGMSGNFLYYRPWHDRFNKFILGRYIPADQEDMKDGRDVMDMLAAHPGTARFISRKLCRRLISDTPPESVVEMAAQVFLQAQADPDQLKQVVRAILLSDEFSQTWGEKIKRPFETAVAMLRALNAEFTRLPDGARWTFEMMGQPLFGRRPPDGYSDVKETWANSM